MEKEVFLDKLKKLVALGKSKQNALDATEINDFFAGDNLGQMCIRDRKKGESDHKDRQQ